MSNNTVPLFPRTIPELPKNRRFFSQIRKIRWIPPSKRNNINTAPPQRRSRYSSGGYFRSVRHKSLGRWSIRIRVCFLRESRDIGRKSTPEIQWRACIFRCRTPKRRLGSSSTSSPETPLIYSTFSRPNKHPSISGSSSRLVIPLCILTHVQNYATRMYLYSE